MKRVRVEDSFWKIFPEAKVYVIKVVDIDNSISPAKNKRCQELLDASAFIAQKYIANKNFGKNEVIEEWHEAFKKFNSAENSCSSIETYLNQVNNGERFTPINPLSTVYTSASLKHAIPAGGQDLDKITGEILLGVSEGGEEFIDPKTGENKPTVKGEVVYRDDNGVLCRSLNWLSPKRTEITTDTKDAIFIFEAIGREQTIRAGEAVAEFRDRLQDYFKVTPDVKILTIDTEYLDKIETIIDSTEGPEIFEG